MTSSLDVELKCEDSNDCISCFDEEALNCVEDKDTISCFDGGCNESIKLVVISFLRAEVTG